jgi:hypothetical protein
VTVRAHPSGPQGTPCAGGREDVRPQAMVTGEELERRWRSCSARGRTGRVQITSVFK